MFRSFTNDTTHAVSTGLYMVKIIELRALENRTKHEVQTSISELRTNKTEKMYIQQLGEAGEE